MPAKLYAVAIDKHPNHEDPHTAIRYIGFASTGDAAAPECIYSVEHVLRILDERSQQLVSLDPDRPGFEVALKIGIRTANASSPPRRTKTCRITCSTSAI